MRAGIKIFLFSWVTYFGFHYSRTNLSRKTLKDTEHQRPPTGLSRNIYLHFCDTTVVSIPHKNQGYPIPRDDYSEMTFE